MGPDPQEPSQSAVNYLYRVLADGARSFPFREGVSSLLGGGDKVDGFITFAPAIYRVGSIRPQIARKGYAMPDRSLSAAVRRLSLSPAVRGKERPGGCFEGCETTEGGNRDGSKEESFAQRGDGDYGMAREPQAATPEKSATGAALRRIGVRGIADNQSTLLEGIFMPAALLNERNSSLDGTGNEECRVHDERPKAPQEKKGTGSRMSKAAGIDGNDIAEPGSHAAKPTKTATGLTADRIDIPGFTDRKVTFQLLATLSEDQSGSSELILHGGDSNLDMKTQVEEEDRNELDKAGKSKEISYIKSQETDSDTNIGVEMSDMAPLPDEEQQCKNSSVSSNTMKGKRVSEYLNMDSAKSAHPGNTHEYRGESGAEARQAMTSLPRHNDFAGMLKETHFRGAAGVRGNGDLSGHYQPGGTLVGKSDKNIAAPHDRDMAGILNTLENHLRRKIDQLRDAARKRPMTGTTDAEDVGMNGEQEPARQMQMPQQQRFVVVRHFSRRNSAPAAFWERSSLGRFRLRPLR